MDSMLDKKLENHSYLLTTALFSLFAKTEFVNLNSV